MWRADQAPSGAGAWCVTGQAGETVPAKELTAEKSYSESFWSKERKCTWNGFSEGDF